MNLSFCSKTDKHERLTFGPHHIKCNRSTSISCNTMNLIKNILQQPLLRIVLDMMDMSSSDFQAQAALILTSALSFQTPRMCCNQKQSAALRDEPLHNQCINKPRYSACCCTDGIHLVHCEDAKPMCSLITVWSDTYLWQQSQLGSCWCCADLCRYRHRRRHRLAERWGSTAPLLQVEMRKIYLIHTWPVTLCALRKG